MRRKVLWFIGLAVIAAVLGIVYRFDPAGGDFPFPRCAFKLLTGWDCPGCGSTRALHSLLHGNIAAAWRVNPAIFVAMLLIALSFAAESPRLLRLRRIIFSPSAALIIIILALLWTIFRNLYNPITL